jgi:hypothetical protein
MRKVLISIAATATALAFATPAAAQYYPQPQAYGYGYGYGQARALHVRLNTIQRQLADFARYRMVTRAEYRNLMNDSRRVERSLRKNTRDGRGLTQRELYNAERRLARLEQKNNPDVRDGRHGSYPWYRPHRLRLIHDEPRRETGALFLLQAQWL